MKKQEDYFMAAKVTDLRSALKMLEDMPGQLIETDAVSYTHLDAADD